MEYWKASLKAAAPFAAMIAVECGEVGLTTLSKAAMLQGMSNFVFIVYYNALGTLILLPIFLYNNLRGKRVPITFSLLYKFFLLGLIGICLLQICAYTGINYSSPTLAAAIGNLIPVFTFILAVILRMEKLDLRKSSSLAKCFGTIIAISGATVVTLYKGPSILVVANSPPNLSDELFSPSSIWALGGLLLVITALLSAIGNILQALSTTVVRNTIITWCLRVRGPVYVATYKPLAIVIAMIMGLIFLGDNLYLGSVIGSIAIAAGFYAVIWGQAEEQDVASNIVHDPESTCEQNAPLLKTTDH